LEASSKIRVLAKFWYNFFPRNKRVFARRKTSYVEATILVCSHGSNDVRIVPDLHYRSQCRLSSAVAYDPTQLGRLGRDENFD